MNLIERFMHIISDPNIAYLLLSIGTLCLMAELSDPGLSVPGIASVVCFVLAFMAIPLLSACSDSGDNSTQEFAPPPPSVPLTLSEAPITLDGISATYAADVSYGDAERNALALPIDIENLDL